MTKKPQSLALIPRVSPYHGTHLLDPAEPARSFQRPREADVAKVPR